MVRHEYKEWDIDVCKIVDAVYGKGFQASIYVKKYDGTKNPLYVLREFSGATKTLSQMAELAKRFIDVI